MDLEDNIASGETRRQYKEGSDSDAPGDNAAYSVIGRKIVPAGGEDMKE
jgi:hypothetical protein